MGRCLPPDLMVRTGPGDPKGLWHLSAPAVPKVLTNLLVRYHPSDQWVRKDQPILMDPKGQLDPKGQRVPPDPMGRSVPEDPTGLWHLSVPAVQTVPKDRSIPMVPKDQLGH